MADFLHGFRAESARDAQLYFMSHDILQSIDRKKQVDLTILNFSKDLDVVSHDKHTIKLEQNDIQRDGSSHFKQEEARMY